MTTYQQEEGLPRAFAYGNTPTHTLENVAPRDIEHDDIMKHLGKWCTVTSRVDKPDGSTVVYFKELSDGELIPMIIPEGTMAVTVLRPTGVQAAEVSRRDPQKYCPICKNLVAHCTCG